MSELERGVTEPTELSEDEVVVQHNLNMFGLPLIDLLKHESLAGNAAIEEIDGMAYSRAAANGYVDVNTGEIKLFTNSTKDKVEEIGPNDVSFCIFATLDRLERIQTGNFRDFFKLALPRARNSEISDRGLRNIQAAIDIYNEQHK